ncbi:hypothetical protein HHL16_24335 [Pseudoflavitalea sp. G-6-1-2]|uniref:hypothetical protein n=1 Tax=Pseudoflavitalea sp. G-6-1-2 TaxID=2728841 RepID=UPI00146CAECF|nr:hypothetical protein [Pseudoflavitalea sp. G-6-1-2]NML24028.1 hypothetical protein [Pseudoflavitalea sp. G-6-1-2]
MTQKSFNSILVLLSLGIILCLSFVAFTELTSKETTLLGIVLTVLSFIASWLVSKYFADKSHKHAIEEVKEQHLSNLRTYALNAAEKVNNLSNELARLSVYLQQELEEDDDELSTEELYLSSYERLESAVHIINTLKSVNDTYLSDWKGVIGEELDEKLEEQQERENELKELVEKVEQIIKNKPQESQLNQLEVQNISKQINDLRKELNLTLNSVSGTFVRPLRNIPKTTKENVQNHCPQCNTSISYKQRPKASSIKFLNCTHCSIKLSSTWSKDLGFVLAGETFIEETVKCATCHANISTLLSNFPTSKSVTECAACGEANQIVRTAKSITISKVNKPKNQPIVVNASQIDNSNFEIIIDENILLQIQNLLPAQPWPKGTHKEISQKLNLNPKVTSKHIQELIRRGIFKPQIDGVLYEAIRNDSAPTPSSN